MTNGGLIAQRLRDEHDVEFLGPMPTRAFTKRNGECRSTFLVVEYHHGPRRTKIDELIRWRWRNQSGTTVVLQEGLTAKALARLAHLHVEFSDLSGYNGLLISDPNYRTKR